MHVTYSTSRRCSAFMGKVLWRTRYGVSLCTESVVIPITHTCLQSIYAATAMAMLGNFGLESLVTQLLPADGVHNLGNILSLSPETHPHFDSLKLWFEATEEVCYWWTSRLHEPDMCTAKLLRSLLLV